VVIACDANKCAQPSTGIVNRDELAHPKMSFRSPMRVTVIVQVAYIVDDVGDGETGDPNAMYVAGARIPGRAVWTWLNGKGADALAYIHRVTALKLPNGGGGRVLDVHGVAPSHSSRQPIQERPSRSEPLRNR
jgi:hypothetical protein